MSWLATRVEDCSTRAGGPGRSPGVQAGAVISAASFELRAGDNSGLPSPRSGGLSGSEAAEGGVAEKA